MKLKLTLATLLVSCALSATAKDYHYETVARDPMQSRIYTLDNGLKVYLSVNKEKPRLQTYIAVRTGSRNDPAETTGLAHYLEHVMFKGTTHFGTSNAAAEAPLLDSIQNRYEAYRRLTDPEARRKAYHGIDSLSHLAAQYNIPNEYDKLMAGLGSEGSNAYTSNDVTCYQEDIPSNEIDNWAKIQSDRFKNMVIRGFHTELEAVYEEFNMGLTNDGRKSWAALNKLLYPNHPYGTQTTIGTQEHLKNPSIVNIKNYFNRYYVPNNVAICMAGDFNPDVVIATIDKYFGDWQPNNSLSRPEYAPIVDRTSPVDTTVVGQEAEYILMGWKTPGAASYAADTLEVIADILSNGKAGLFDIHLNQPMKLQEASAYFEGLHDYGQLFLEAMPKEGQKLEELQSLMLAEISKLKRGEFDDKLLPAVINNLKLSYFKSLLSNSSRANKFVNAFINDQKWEDQVHALDRMSGMTKQQIVDFANRYLLDNYVTVFKRQGTDNSVQKIDKPAITAIPTNSDMQSDFLKTVVNTEVEPIQPKFVDFNKDMAQADVDATTKLLYKHNDADDLFTLKFDFPVGTENSNAFNVATTLLDYAGTNKMTANEIKSAFYGLACNYSVNVSKDHTGFTISGLSENMSKALNLFVHLMENARIGKKKYSDVVSLILKDQQDQKKSQGSNFSALRNYGIYGEFNPTRNQMNAQELKSASGNELLKSLRDIRHLSPMTVMYFGPEQQTNVASLVKQAYPKHKVSGKLPLTTKKYQAQPTEKSEVLIAPYDAKNIYMMQYTNGNRQWTLDKAPIEDLFNAYFGGGMGSIVFQELREARGLAYHASAQYAQPNRKGDPEFFYTYIISQNDKMMDCVNVFNTLLSDMPQRQAGFDLAKQNLMKSIATSRTTRFDVLQYYKNLQELGYDHDTMKDIFQKMPSLTLADLLKFAQENISNKPYKYLILGDEKNLDLKSLEKIAPIRRVSTKEIFGF